MLTAKRCAERFWISLTMLLWAVMVECFWPRLPSGGESLFSSCFVKERYNSKRAGAFWLVGALAERGGGGGSGSGGAGGGGDGGKDDSGGDLFRTAETLGIWLIGGMEDEGVLIIMVVCSWIGSFLSSNLLATSFWMSLNLGLSYSPTAFLYKFKVTYRWYM